MSPNQPKSHKLQRKTKSHHIKKKTLGRTPASGAKQLSKTSNEIIKTVHYIQQTMKILLDYN